MNSQYEEMAIHLEFASIRAQLDALSSAGRMDEDTRKIVEDAYGAVLKRVRKHLVFVERNDGGSD